MKFWYFLGSARFQYQVKMKRFRKVFSKLDKIVPQTTISLGVRARGLYTNMAL